MDRLIIFNSMWFHLVKKKLHQVDCLQDLIPGKIKF